MIQLTQAQVQKNKAIFQALNQKYQILPEALLSFLGEDFYHAPASTSTSMNNACEGGLLDHLLTTVGFAKKINDILPATLQQPAINVYRAAILSGVGKTFMFTPNVNEYSRKNGKMYDFVSGTTAMSVGERSVLYALRHGVELTDDEYQAIINSDRIEEDNQVKWYGSSLTTIIRHAIELAVMEQKKRT